MEDYFARLGLPRRFSFSRAEIDTAYRERSRQVHPDQHQGTSQSAHLVSRDMTAAVNEAYTVLRDPYKRANYLLSQFGGPSATELRDIPPEFLEEVLMLRMEMEELDANSPQLQAMEQKLQAQRDRLFEELAPLLDTGSQDLAHLQLCRKKLNAVHYIVNLLRDIRLR